jgi:hypothetical protein
MLSSPRVPIKDGVPLGNPEVSFEPIVFHDYPEFQPNLTPSEIFRLGSFGGTYWRPIYSSVTNRRYVNQHRKYPKSWWTNIPQDWLTLQWADYDKSINRYKVSVGTTLEFWESKNWIHKSNPYGWVQWYCGFYQGVRTEDDERQIKRWKNTAGPNSRFRKQLINRIHDSNGTCNDYTISPKIRQTLQHWGYILQKYDCD